MICVSQCVVSISELLMGIEGERARRPTPHALSLDTAVAREGKKAGVARIQPGFHITRLHRMIT